MKTSRWIPLLTAVALAASAGLCQAQSLISYNFASSLQGWDLSQEPAGMTDATMTWNSTNSSTGGGCMEMTMDGTNTTELDPIVTLPTTVNEANYLEVTVHMMVAPGSGTVGTTPPIFGDLQIAFRNASYSFDSIWYGALYTPGANLWQTYTFFTQNPYPSGEQYLQIQLSGTGQGSYSGPVTVYIDNVSIVPLPDPWLENNFTNDAIISSAWDPTEAAPYYNPVTGAGPTNFPGAGSWEVTDTGPYANWNQYQFPAAVDMTRYQNFGFDVRVDGISGGTTYGGVQLILWANGWSADDKSIGAVNFNASMVGEWTHFNFPCDVSGYTECPAIVFQPIPGSDGGTNDVTFHLSNFEMWSPATQPRILSLAPNSYAGGVKIQVDADGTANQYDQEGLCTPSATNAVADFFWINNTPATYSFTLTNFPSPTVAPGFEAHLYIVNGDSIASGGTGGFGYNETYSGVNWNAYDLAWFQVENGTNGTISCNFLWKTNAPSSTATNEVSCVVSNLANADGTWALNFLNNTQADITLNGTLETNFTLPDFLADPNYNGNSFTPVTSFIDFGVWKNDFAATGVNDNKAAVFTQVIATNTSVAISDSFGGPGLDANYAWLVAEYYEDASDRVTWLPSGTAYWLTWNSPLSGFVVQSTANLLGTWSPAGVTYTYIDTTGTNTVGAIPTSSLPAGNQDFFGLLKQ